MARPMSSLRLRGTGAVWCALALVALGACGSSGGSAGSAPSGDATTSGTRASASVTTTAADATTGSSTTAAVASTTTTAPALPDASTAPRSAPGEASSVALLRAVRVGRNTGFERIVYEFAGTAIPGYRICWVDPPILSDGAGEPVDVTGDAYLQMVFEPASGVDLSSPDATVVYQGPDRIPVAGQTRFIEDLVRTGDFEAVLTWVAGTRAEAPFRVLTLRSPTRIVVDIAT